MAIENKEAERLESIRVRREAEDRVQARRLKVRERLQQSAAESVPPTQEQRELQRLLVYLGDWAASEENVQPKLGTSGSSLADYAKSSSPTMTQLLSSSNAWALGIIDASIADLLGMIDGTKMRAALRVRWLNEGLVREAGIQIRVFRSGRLTSMTMEEVDELADRAERALVPICKRKGLPLSL